MRIAAVGIADGVFRLFEGRRVLALVRISRWPDGCCQVYYLPDLPKLPRRREAFKRRPQHRIRVRVPSSRAVELRERKRGAQFEAAGFLRLRDGDGGEEGILGGLRV